MSNPNYITVTRDLVKRGWSDFEPKVIAGLLTGSVGAFLIPIAAGFGIHLSAIQANYAVIGFYFLGSYFTPSAGTTVTKTESTGIGQRSESETHSGNAVSVVTSSTPVQRPGVDESGSVYTTDQVPGPRAVPEPVDDGPRPFIWGTDNGSTADNAATRVIN